MAIVEIVIEDIEADNPLCQEHGLVQGLVVYVKGEQVIAPEDVTHAQMLATQLLRMINDPNFLSFVMGRQMGIPIDISKRNH